MSGNYVKSLVPCALCRAVDKSDPAYFSVTVAASEQSSAIRLGDEWSSLVRYPMPRSAPFGLAT